jgi:hypothetical protein
MDLVSSFLFSFSESFNIFFLHFAFLLLPFSCSHSPFPFLVLTSSPFLHLPYLTKKRFGVLDNPHGIGAMVTITAGTTVQSQIVGGSTHSFKSQHHRRFPIFLSLLSFYPALLPLPLYARDWGDGHHHSRHYSSVSNSGWKHSFF